VELNSEQTVESISKFAYDGLEYLFESRGLKRERSAAYAMIKTRAIIGWRNPFTSSNFQRQYLKVNLIPHRIAKQRLKEIIQYAVDIDNGDIFPCPILVKRGTSLIQADGARRIIANRLAGKTETEVVLVLERGQILEILETAFVENIQHLHDQNRWFDSYQDIVELCISGKRKAAMRFPDVLDFSCCKNKVVVDFGCSTGHALFEAYYNGATKCIGFEYTQKNVDIINKIAIRLRIPVEAHCVDFNNTDFEYTVRDIIPNWDYSLFLSVYRTKELCDRDALLRFIWENTHKGMFFEGHSEPIDTEEFYSEVFSQLTNAKISFLGTASDLGNVPRRNYFIEKMEDKQCW
jgi:SAM-dependent methyltransferase